MITESLIDKVEGPLQLNVKQALGIIAVSGIIEAELALRQASLLEGSDEEPVEELAKRIIGYRIATQTIESFRQLCQQYVGENR